MLLGQVAQTQAPSNVLSGPCVGLTHGVYLACCPEAGHGFFLLTTTIYQKIPLL